jgi:hypothetical protein
MRTRHETVEHPFGTIKARMGATHFLMKRLPNVAAEMALHILAYNLTRDEYRGKAEADLRDLRRLTGRTRVQRQPVALATTNLLTLVDARLRGHRATAAGLALRSASRPVSTQPRPIADTSSVRTRIHPKFSIQCARVAE